MENCNSLKKHNKNILNPANKIEYSQVYYD